ncbi:MAG: diadenylate cyclase [Planctomycetaceae bacterium]|nr:diadenylate cyclase [Planctomycetaceae bacterium]
MPEAPKLEPLKFTEQFRFLVGNLRLLRQETEAEAILVFPEVPVDWGKMKKILGDEKVIVCSIKSDYLSTAVVHGYGTIHLHFEGGTSIYEKISHAVIEAVADGLIQEGGCVLALYSALDPSHLDSITIFNLSEHLEKLSRRDLQQLESSVPLKVLKTVVDLAVDIGWEGREGKPIGTMFVVGDTNRVMAQSRELCFDPVKGYKRHERSIFDTKVREGVKEISQLDGAVIISKEGIVEAACRYLESQSTATISLSPGLGARHMTAAAISRTTSALAITVSQSSGTIRIFKNGEVALRIESRQRTPLVWRDFDQDRPE